MLLSYQSVFSYLVIHQEYESIRHLAFLSEFYSSQNILKENNPETLKRWPKLAAKVDSVEEFISIKD